MYPTYAWLASTSDALYLPCNSGVKATINSPADADGVIESANAPISSTNGQISETHVGIASDAAPSVTAGWSVAVLLSSFWLVARRKAETMRPP